MSNNNIFNFFFLRSTILEDNREGGLNTTTTIAKTFMHSTDENSKKATDFFD